MLSLLSFMVMDMSSLGPVLMPDKHYIMFLFHYPQPALVHKIKELTLKLWTIVPCLLPVQ